MYQKLILIGNLGNTPETRYTAKGDPVTSFAATSRQVRRQTRPPGSASVGQASGGLQQVPRKGSKVLVEGRLRPDAAATRPRSSARTARPGASFEVTAENVRLRRQG